MIFAVEASIAAPAALVWRYLTEPRLLATWMPGAADATVDGGGDLTADGILTLHAGEEQSRAEVVDFADGERISLRMDQRAMTAVYTYRLRGEGEGSVVRLEVDGSVRGVARLAAPLIRALIRTADHGQLERLKTAIEAADSGAGSPGEGDEVRE